jgi:hypothetical protein
LVFLRDGGEGNSGRRKRKRRKRSRSKRRQNGAADGDAGHGRQGRSKDKQRKKSNKNKRRKEDSSSSSSPSSSSDSEPSDHSSSSSSDESDTDDSTTDDSQSGRRLSAKERKEKKKRRAKRELNRIWRLLAEAWPIEQRPPYLRKKSGIKGRTLAELLAIKEHMSAEDLKKNLGQEIFQRDGVPKKVKYKAQSDNGTTKLHPARFNRPPLSHPKEYYKLVPKKHDVIIRNFPMDHLGLNGQVSEATIGKLHNRSVPLTFEAFGKSSHKAGKTGCPAGKYSDLMQLQEGLMNYGSLLLSMWNLD